MKKKTAMAKQGKVQTTNQILTKISFYSKRAKI